MNNGGRVFILPDGEVGLDARAIAAVIYASRLEDVREGQPRERVRVFQARVDAYRQAQELAHGSRPAAEDALAALIDFNRVEAAMRAGDREAILAAVFDVGRGQVGDA